MQRVTITMDDSLAQELDAFIAEAGKANRSEAVRELLRQGLAARKQGHEDAACFGILGYAIDHTVRDLARRVPQGRMDRHDETVAALSVPVDHSSTVDVVVMRGTVGSVSAYAHALFAERGILHGNLTLMPVAPEHHAHSHDHDAPAHVHLRVQETF